MRLDIPKNMGYFGAHYQRRSAIAEMHDDATSRRAAARAVPAAITFGKPTISELSPASASQSFSYYRSRLYYISYTRLAGDTSIYNTTSRASTYNVSTSHITRYIISTGFLCISYFDEDGR